MFLFVYVFFLGVGGVVFFFWFGLFIFVFCLCLVVAHVCRHYMASSMNIYDSTVYMLENLNPLAARKQCLRAIRYAKGFALVLGLMLIFKRSLLGFKGPLF